MTAATKSFYSVTFTYLFGRVCMCHGEHVDVRGQFKMILAFNPVGPGGQNKVKVLDEQAEHCIHNKTFF